MISNKKLRMALLGFGYLGKWHAQKLSQNTDVEFVAIVEPYVKAHEDIKKSHPQVRIVLDVKEILSEIDAALVVTPTSMHLKHVEFLIENNKHVFCEKPLAHNYSSSLSLFQLSEKYPHLVTQVGHSERCHKIFQDESSFFRELVSKDSFCNFERYGAFKGRATDVSCVEDIMVHDLDLMMYVFKPQLLTCHAVGIKSKTKNWDTVQATFKTATQTFNFFVSRDATEEKRMMSCFSSLGTAVINFMNNSLVTTTGSELIQKTYEKRDHLTFEQNAFIQSIQNKSAPMVKFHDGVIACYLVEVVLESLKTQKTQQVVIPQ